MIYTDDMRDWLKAGLVADWPGVTFAVGSVAPNRWGTGTGELVLVAPTAGPGLTQEHVFDNRAWYVQILGPQSRDARINDAVNRTERLAYAVDEFILFTSPRPLIIAGTRVNRVQRFGSMGTPTALGAGVERAPWTATYVTEVPTKLAILGA